MGMANSQPLKTNKHRVATGLEKLNTRTFQDSFRLFSKTV